VIGYEQFIAPESLVMMRRVLNAECFRRSIKPDSSEAEELALIIMDAFRTGMTNDCDLLKSVRSGRW